MLNPTLLKNEKIISKCHLSKFLYSVLIKQYYLVELIHCTCLFIMFFLLHKTSPFALYCNVPKVIFSIAQDKRGEST